MWRIVEAGKICQSCYEDNKNILKSELEPEGAETSAISNGAEEKKLRKSTRSTRYKAKSGTAAATVSQTGTTSGGNGGGSNAQSGPTPTSKTVPKGRGRRNIFKKPPIKAPIHTATTTSVDSLFYNVRKLNADDMILFYTNMLLGVLCANWRYCVIDGPQGGFILCANSWTSYRLVL